MLNICTADCYHCNSVQVMGIWERWCFRRESEKSMEKSGIQLGFKLKTFWIILVIRCSYC